MKFFKQMLAMLVLLGTAQLALAGAELGRDYKQLGQAQPTLSGSKIEVLEFFFYGCSHCYHLHPLMSSWEKSMAKDVELQYVPVIFRDSWEPMARTFYALESLGQLKALHDALFKAWNVDGIDLTGEAQATEFVAKRGIDRAKFSAAYNSFSVQSKVTRSNQMQQSYQIRGTPTLVVDGKYVITGLGPEATIQVLNDVIAKARKERSKK